MKNEKKEKKKKKKKNKIILRENKKSLMFEQKESSFVPHSAGVASWSKEYILCLCH